MRPTPDGPRIHAGIDEAGLGPLLGPLCIGWCVTSSPSQAKQLNHWDLWNSAVSQKHPRKSELLFVADSKRVFDGSPSSRVRLAATALSFLRAAGNPAVCGRDLLHSPVPPLRPQEEASAPWFGSWLQTLPSEVPEQQLKRQAAALEAAMESSACRVLEAAVRIAPAGELNASFERTQNKAVSTWALVAPILTHLWQIYGQRQVAVVLDRQGGRRHYGGLLAQEFPFCEIQTLRESSDLAQYRICGAERRMLLTVRPKAEDSSLPVAVGSCLAKYARESVMGAFNRWFTDFQEELKPTAGYVTDARRWLLDARPALAKAKVPTELLIRTR